MADYVEQTGTVGDNFQILNNRLAVSEEQRKICVGQMMRLVCDRGAELGIDGVYSEFDKMLGGTEASDKALLCKHICEIKGFFKELDEKNIFGEGEAAVAGTHGRIAYVRNKRNDEVFLEFSKKLRGARAHYATSFIDACESVFNNACEFCILPVENNTDGKLYSFYSMLDRYELRIFKILRKENEDASESVNFALAGRCVDKSFDAGRLKRFEFSVVREERDILEDVISVAKALGGRISSVGTLPVPYDDKRSKYYFAVDLRAADAVPMALYMTMEYPRYTPIGLYTVNE